MTDPYERHLLIDAGGGYGIERDCDPETDPDCRDDEDLAEHAAEMALERRRERD